jgi:hypothetical protein
MLALLFLQLAVPAAAAVAADCSALEHRQLDFWLGSWTVIDARTDKAVGTSDITSTFRGCALQERFAAADSFEGGSLSMWDCARREWVQFGTGSTGARRMFAGRWDGTKISLLTQQDRPDASTLLIRMHLKPLDGGQVRQWSETSSDYGATWRIRYDYIYRRAG